MIQKLNENYISGTPLSAKSLNKIVNKLNEISGTSKLDLSFENGQTLCAEDLNAIRDKINELIDQINSQTDDVYGIKVIKYSNSQFDSDGGTYSIKAYVTKNGKYYSDDVTINSTLENDGENFIIPQSDTDQNYGIEITSPYGDKTISISQTGGDAEEKEDTYSLYVSDFPSTVSTDGGTVTIITSIQKNGVNNTSKGIQVNLNYPQGVTSNYKDNGVIRTYTITFPKNETFNSKVLSGTISAGTIGSKNISISQGATAPTQTVEVYANGGGNITWDANSVTFSFYAIVNGQSITSGVTPEIVTNEVGATLSSSNNGSATYTITKNTGTSNRTLIVRAKYQGKYSNNVSFIQGINSSQGGETPSEDEFYAIFYDTGLGYDEVDPYITTPGNMKLYENAFELGRVKFVAGSRQGDFTQYKMLSEDDARAASLAKGRDRSKYLLNWDMGLYDTMPRNDVYIKAQWEGPYPAIYKVLLKGTNGTFTYTKTSRTVSLEEGQTYEVPGGENQFKVDIKPTTGYTISNVQFNWTGASPDSQSFTNTPYGEGANLSQVNVTNIKSSGTIFVEMAKTQAENQSIQLSYDNLDWPIRDEEVILGMTGETFLVYARRYEDGSPAADMSLSKAPTITIVGDGEYMLTQKSVDVNGHDYVYEYEVNNDLYENAHFTISAEFDGVAGANTLDLKQGTSGGNLCYCILTTDKGEEYISKLEYQSSGTGVGSTNRMDVRGIDYHAGSYELTYKFVMYKDGEKIPTTGLKLASIRQYGNYAKEDNWYTCSTQPEGGPGHPDGSVTSIGEDTYKISMTFTESPEVYWRAADLELQVYFSDGSYQYIDSFVYQFPYIYLRAHTDYSRSWQQLIYGEYGVNPITCEGGYPIEEWDPGYSENIYLDCYKYDNDINSSLEGSYTQITSTEKGTPKVRLMDSNYQTGQQDGLEYEPVEIEKLEESEYTSYAKTYHLTLKPNHSGKQKIAVYFADLVDSNGNIVYTSEDTYIYGYEVQFQESC